MLKDFRDFVGKGNAIDLAVGVIIGSAISTILKSFVDELVVPLTGLLSRVDFSNMYFVLKGTVPDGTPLGEARKVIADAGHGDHFGHSLGHGIGLYVHEYPRVAQRATNLLEDGMVFSNEPGVYLTGWGGVRIEDLLVLEGGKVRNITKASKLSTE